MNGAEVLVGGVVGNWHSVAPFFFFFFFFESFVSYLLVCQDKSAPNYVLIMWWVNVLSVSLTPLGVTVEFLQLFYLS